MQVKSSPKVSSSDKKAIAILALTEMQKEVKSLPEDARIRFEMAMGYAAFGDYKDALTQIAIAHALSPKKETIMLEEGIFKLQSGDLKGAADIFKKVYALAPQFKSLAIYGAVGEIFDGNQEKANTILKKNFGTITVDNPMLAEAYAVTKNYAPLLAIYRARVARAGSSTNDVFRLAMVEALAGHVQKALKQVRAVIASNPKVKEAGEAVIKQIKSGNIR